MSVSSAQEGLTPTLVPTLWLNVRRTPAPMAPVSAPAWCLTTVRAASDSGAIAMVSRDWTWPASPSQSSRWGMTRSEVTWVMSSWSRSFQVSNDDKRFVPFSPQQANMNMQSNPRKECHRNANISFEIIFQFIAWIDTFWKGMELNLNSYLNHRIWLNWLSLDLFLWKSFSRTLAPLQLQFAQNRWAL